MFLLGFHEFVMEDYKIFHIETKDTSFLLNRKCDLFIIRSSLPVQLLGVDAIRQHVSPGPHPPNLVPCTYPSRTGSDR